MSNICINSDVRMQIKHNKKNYVNVLQNTIINMYERQNI
jgi:hypothetical protein